MKIEPRSRPSLPASLGYFLPFHHLRAWNRLEVDWIGVCGRTLRCQLKVMERCFWSPRSTSPVNFLVSNPAFRTSAWGLGLGRVLGI